MFDNVVPGRTFSFFSVFAVLNALLCFVLLCSVLDGKKKLKEGEERERTKAARVDKAQADGPSTCAPSTPLDLDDPSPLVGLAGRESMAV